MVSEQEYPDLPAPTLPKETVGNKWTVDEIVTFLATSEGMQGNRERGMEVFDRCSA